MERAQISNQFGQPVTTGHTQYDWPSKYSHRTRTLPNTFPPLPATKTLQFSDCAPSLQSGDLELLHFPNRRNGSDSMESMQQHVSAEDPIALSDPDSVSITETDDSGDEYGEQRAELLTTQNVQGSGNLRFPIGKASKEKRKVGRPIAYRGDPNAPELTEQERRRIKRRIANRESARRVRHKRQEMVDELQVKIDSLQAQNADLKLSVNENKQQKDELSRQLKEITGMYKKTVATNANMQLELESLRTSLQLRMNALENALDRQEIGVNVQEDKTSFGSAQAQAMAGYSPQPTFPFQPQGEFKGSFSYQMALQDYPSFQLGERSVELLPSDHPDLALLTHTTQSNPNLPS